MEGLPRGTLNEKQVIRILSCILSCYGCHKKKETREYRSRNYHGFFFSTLLTITYSMERLRSTTTTKRRRFGVAHLKDKKGKIRRKKSQQESKDVPAATHSA